MKTQITIVCSSEVPAKHLLNNTDFDVYECKGDESIFTMIAKEKSIGELASDLELGTNNLGAKGGMIFEERKSLAKEMLGLKEDK